MSQHSLFGAGGGPEDRTLYYGDCLTWMTQWDDKTVDLIYLDPPFKSDANYNILFRDRGAGKAQYRAFDDTWHWNDRAEARLAVYQGAAARPARRAVLGLYEVLGECGMLAYLTYMAERLEQMKRILKPTGSIYLHCDPTASHYLKVLMDAVFGVPNFRNEVHWYYYNKMHDRRKKLFAAASDTMLFYVRDIGSDFTFRQLTEIREKPVRQLVRKKVRGKMVNARDQHGKLMYQTKRRRTIDNVWRIPCLQPASKERLGYPTQKPLKLLDRVISASTNPGDLVLDPFCGCGTAVDAANRLNRRWAGIDISSFAIDLICDRRMADQHIEVKGTPFSLKAAERLARERPFEFESWAIMRMAGFRPNTVRGRDGGVDGRATLAVKPSDHDSRLALAQVKGGRFSLSQLRDFLHVTNREKAALGVYVTLNPVRTKGAQQETWKARTVRVGAEEYPRCQLWSIADYFEGRRPHLPTMTDPYTGRPLNQGELFA
ncbi:MAG: DNA methyltransferase [Gemmatimonadota bacterium]|nr:DNA methyltransferase [Gemmatimonadota bacterium]